MGSFSESGWEWNLLWRRNLFDNEMGIASKFIDQISAIRLNSNLKDTWVWRADTNGIFSTKSAYQVLKDEQHSEVQHLAFHQLWDIKIPPRALSFAWRLLWDKLPTKDNLARRQIQTDSDICPFCHSKPESASHLFFTCDKIQPLWWEFLSWVKEVKIIHCRPMDNFLQHSPTVVARKQRAVWLEYSVKRARAAASPPGCSENGYAPQVGLAEHFKVKFWEDLKGVLQDIPQGEKVFLGGDLNGHVGSVARGFEGVHGGFGLGEMNGEGKSILEFSEALDVSIANTWFKKREEHLITYKSGGTCSQIDFFLTRKSDRKYCLNCKVIPGESLTTQHRALVMDGEKQGIFQQKIWEGWCGQSQGSANDMWNKMSQEIIKVAKETLGESRGFGPRGKESWWWNESVQSKVREWSRWRNSETWDKYKIARNETKKAVSEARAQAFDGLYQALGTRDGERSIYRLAKGRERKTRDLDQVKCVKDEEGKVLVHEKDIKERWKAYFHNLFNDGYGYDSSSLDTREEDRNYKYYRRIQKQEVKEALKRMSNGKAVGPDNIPIEVWKTLGDRGLEWLTKLFNEIMSKSKSEYMECKFNKRRRVSNSEVKIGDYIIPQVTRFKYLGSVIQDDGQIEGDVNHRIQAGWMKWRKASGVLCDAKVPIKLKGKFYRTAVRPAILYGTECWAVKSQHENKVGVAEMRMLRWMCGKTRQDKIRNEAIRERVGVAPIVEKMVENRLRWFGHVERRPVDSVVRRVDQMERRQTIRGRGRPKKTIREVIKKDLELNDLDRRTLATERRWKIWWLVATNSIWKLRNDIIFHSQSFDISKLANSTLFLMWTWLKGWERDFSVPFLQWSSAMSLAFN
ncbi:Craniofacial development protein 2 [Glycine soja]